MFYQLFIPFQFLDGAIKSEKEKAAKGSRYVFQFLDGAIKSMEPA